MRSMRDDSRARPPDVMLTQAAPAIDGTPGADVLMVGEHDDEPSDASSYDPEAALLGDDTTQLNGASNNKRKTPGSTDLSQASNVKRARLQADGPFGSREPHVSGADGAKQLPAEIWQHIFTFLPPRHLGRLLSVNKLFHAFLNPSSSSTFAPSHSVLPSSLAYLKPDAIWQASRRQFWPRMPAPLKGKSELHMWRLVCSASCQFCGSKGDLQSSIAADEWHRGPGAKGVSPIFPLCVCTCGRCLEIDVLLSSIIPSLLLPALPPILLTDHMHVITPRVLQTGVLPPDTQVTKFFWSEHIEQIKSEFEQVKVLGAAAAEEWIKGLEIRGKQALADASRWEKWDFAGGLGQVRTSLSPIKSGPLEAKRQLSVAPSSPKPLPSHHLPNSAQNHDEQQDRAFGTNHIPGLTVKPDMAHQQSRSQGQQKRTKEEVAQLKSQRRADIERRAMLLDPPLTASVLAHIPSFQAALQLITPLDDNAWELLKPRLLAQRQEAETRDRENTANSRALRDKLVVQKNGKKPAQVPREVSDQEWDDIQGPVRVRISAYADEIIKGWNNGEKLKKKNCPQLAADVLLYVRKRFYAEIAKDAAAAAAARKPLVVEPPEGPWTQKLTLENMKWVFDMKIKPHTEQFRKELFICNSCNGTLKFFGFEGVIQHYAAKHTSALSLGNVVVHWRAEWPEVPPFSPEPRAIELAHFGKTANYSLPPVAPQLQQGYAGYQLGPPTGYAPPGYGAPASAPLLPEYSSGPPIQMPPTSAYAQAGPHGYGASYSSVPYPDNAAYASFSQPFSAELAYSPHDQPNGYAVPPVPAPPAFDYGLYPNHQATYGASSADNTYQSRLDTMAKVTKDTWFKMAGVKNVPITIKICAVIHHISKIFHNDHNEVAPLAMFIDGLSTHKDMRCIRNVTGLSCNVCLEDRKISLHQLVNHFMKQHVEGQESQGMPPLDWRLDMVSLLTESDWSGLKQLLKHNRSAYAIVSDAIPWAFEEAYTDTTEQQRPPRSRSEKASSNKKTNGKYEYLVAAFGEHGSESQAQGRYEIENRLQQPPDYGHSEPQAVREEDADRGHILPHVQSHVQHHVGPKQDIPHLRPASEIYGSKKKAGVAAAQDTSAAGTSDRHPASTYEGAEKAATHDERRAIKTEYPEDHHGRPGVVQPQHGTHWRDERSLDYRDVREPRYSVVEPPVPRDRSASVGNRPQDSRHSVHPPVNTIPDFPEARPRAEHSRPDFVENYESMIKEEVVYVDESGREIGRGMRARDTLPQGSRYGVPDDSMFDSHRYPPSPWYEGHESARYRERSPRPRHAPPAHRYEPESTSRRGYYDYHDTRAPPEPPVEAYELVEVRGPQGDYFIRRPIRHDERDYYAHDSRRPPRDHHAYAGHRVSGEHLDSRMGYAPDPPAASVAPGQPAVRPAYDDYDPRYPSASTGERAAYHGNAR
ncbi:hypothetical protein FZEAL_6810 [Fusarium zealandicum]|uniref:F-box domain-containing protein n=1 Tax=Fusarium zealandicum TaxID=1053134 RepID=A0A8H4UH65_9HYPO|nr:hypothetical protein FZEAL_6810 [Fusarium zealandicum]